jgi:hypothetical protein
VSRWSGMPIAGFDPTRQVIEKALGF